MLAVLTDSNTDLLDYLLSNGVVADAIDRCGCVVFSISTATIF